MENIRKNLKAIVNNLTISFTDEGPVDAPAIIFIHGFPFNKSMWAPQLDVFREDYRVIAFDIRGFGDSDSGEEDFSMDLFANDLIFLMDALNINKPVLCGLSMGGYIALKAIIKFPEHFQALVLSDTQCTADTPEARGKRMKSIADISRHGVESYVEGSIKNLFSTVSFSTKQKEIRETREMMANNTEKTLTNTLMALSRRKGTCSKMQDIKIPVLIMVGQEDKLTPPAAAQLMHENIQGSILKILDHAGHLANLENPEAFNLQLSNFMHQFNINQTQPRLLKELTATMLSS